MKKIVTVLFFSLFLLITFFGSVNYAQMPPHPTLAEKIKKGIVELPEIIKNKSELRSRGIDAPWKAQVDQKLSSPLNIDKNRVVGPALVPSGNWRALVVLVQFSDKAQQVNATYFDNMIFSQTSGTLWDYYKDVSYNALDIVTVNLPSSIGWVTAPSTYAYYCDNEYGIGTYPRNSQKLVEDVVNLINPSVNFSNYDNDGDGYVDALFVVHTGTGAEVTGNTTDIWSHAWSTVLDMNVDGVKVRRYSVEPEYWLSPGDMTIGVYAHELGHAAFGLPDLYDTDNSSEGLGNWSLMASGSWNGSLGNTPSFPDAWSHIQMGYATPTNVSSNLYGQSIVQTTQAPQIFKLWRNGSPGSQYFLVQNRQKSGYDAGLPGSGLAIYHIDDNVTTDNDKEWYPGYTSSGHYLVALEQADGLWQLEKTSRGDAGDLYPGSSNVINFNNGTTPNTKDYSASATNVSVNNISSSGPIMTADLLITQVTPTVTVTSPNGGENWKVGTIQNITWTSTSVTNVKLEYSVNNGTSWATIIASTSASAGSYGWTIPNFPSPNCKIRISDASDSGVNDQSDNTFTIYQPTLTLTSPNGGENWKAGSLKNITWTSSNVNSVKLEYTTNNGANWLTIVASVSASAGSYTWTVPNISSAICKVRISDFSDATLSDVSDNVFTIYQPMLTLTTPNGGESWVAGSSQNITWTSSNVSNVKLEYTTNNGTNWITVIESTPAAAGSYNWTIPNTPSTNCKVRLSEIGDPLISDESDNVFTISELLIALNSPNGGENWKVGVSQSITWLSNNITNIKLEYTTNNGTSWVTIIESTPASTGSYSWTIPNTPSTNCKVRISDAGNAAVNDLSDNVFTIYQPTITLTTPNSGESWKVGTNQNITWTSSNVTNVKLEYTTNNGTNWSTIIESTPASTGSYSWTVPNTSSTNCKVRVSDVSDAAISDLSDNVFTIYQPTIALTTPNGGENWKVGTTQNITWTSSNVENVKLEYTTNNGTNWVTIIESTPASAGSFVWTIPNTPSVNCKVRIIDVNDVAINDMSDNVFTIYLPTLTLISPNGGENWKVGAIQNITWTSSNITNIKLEYTINNGVNWNTIIESLAASTGSYSWTIPNAPSANCKVRISDTGDATTNDLSNNVFTIYQPTIALTTPNGGESWKVGTTQNITWTSSNVANVKLEYTTNDGTNWVTIIESTPASAGSYVWTIPNVPSVNYKVRINDVSDAAINDLSDNFFTIYQPVIILTTPNGGENWKVGSTRNITWASSNVANLKLEYTTNSGTDWVTIIESTPSSAGSYGWTIPNVPSSNCKVRVSDVSDAAINDLSDNVFTIYQPTLVLSTPNGGENLKVGTIQNITWTSSNVTNVKLEYTTNNGTSWSTIIESTPASAGSYSWTIPNTSSSNCKIRISDLNDSEVTDQVDNSFTIYQPIVLVNIPNEGESWKVGTTQNITWTSSNVANVKLEYSTNNGTTWVTIVESVDASTGNYGWIIPNTPSTNCKVKISDADDAAINDLSDNNFTIYKPTVILATPNGGENWKVGTTQNITWSSSNVANVKLEYTTNNGTDWISIIESTPASTGSYNWTVPNTPSTNCKLRISDASDAAINDPSDNIFTIYKPSLALLSPNGGENLLVGSSQNITWTTDNITNVKLEYTTNNGTNWITIIESTPASSGSYGWTIPNTVSTNCKIRISSPNDPEMSDQSENNFTIYLPSLTLTSPNGGESWLVGSTQNITWSSASIKNIRIEYTTNGGLDWLVLADKVNSSLKSVAWRIPNYPSQHCKVRITSVEETQYNDESNSEFLIFQPTLILTSPNGGESWKAGTTQNITWTSSNVANVKLEYTTNNGTSWSTIIESTPASAGSYSWTVPNTPSTNCKVRISDASDSAINDLSNNVFTIYQPTLTLVSPNGNENWIVGTNKDIIWTSSNVANVKLEYTTNNGTNWSTIIESTSATAGSYNWTIPNTPSVNCKVRISDVDDAEMNDLSENIFTINSIPEIQLVSPDGDEKWKVGAIKNISWVANNVSQLLIQLSTDDGVNWLTIDDNVQASPGGFNWKIPDSTSKLCRVRIVDAVHPEYSDTSNQTFIIWKPIEITKITTAGQNNLNFDPTHISLSAFVSNPAPVTVIFYEYESPAGGNLPDSVIGISDFYWQIISPGISFSNGEISIPGYLAGETSDSTYNVWLKREDNGDDWISIGGASLSGMLSNTSSFNIFSEFAIGKKINAPIPVELISFNANAKGNDVVLSWKTATETNNRGFEIERKIVNEQGSNNSAGFTSIGFVNGKGNSTQINSYNFTDKNVTGNGKAIYRLKQIDFNGKINLSSNVEVKLEAKPKEYSLSQNYPNPFNPATKIRYQIPEAGWVTLKVYNLLGNEVATLVNEKKNAGNYDVEFSAKNISSGIYIYKLSCGNFSSTKRMILLK
ncbi:MAG: M6 family metalloprotease domain-containing protein [Ignavibacteriales bacterium]|nr:MAG: M6 family metalloprotease domain-containing protein [Ignavibacteriales bacterium]